MPMQDTIALPSTAGLEKEAEILVDRWGIPHIYAATQQDAFFVQGFNAARDRLLPDPSHRALFGSEVLDNLGLTR